jgi:tRNA(Ile)-lysidine synthase
MLNLETFKEYWDVAFPDLRLRRTHFVVAVSGGVDSIVLAHIMHTLKANCTIAHVNFQLRGTESDGDEQFVRDFASQYQIPIQVHKVDTQNYALTYKLGIQEAAREIRYAWFGALMQQIAEAENNKVQSNELHALTPKPKPVVLLTAHHANDQVETILMHLFRGTGIHGLTGIPARRNDVLNLARPLIQFTKAAITEYAAMNGLKFVEDSSNAKEEYTRNYIRNVLIPNLNTQYPTIHENIIATSKRVKEADDIVSEAVAHFWKKGLIAKKGILTIPIHYWNKVKGNGTYTWGIIKQFGFKAQQLEEVHKILTASKGAMIASNTHQLIQWGDEIQIVPIKNEQEYSVIEASTIHTQIEKGQPIASVPTQTGILQFEYIENFDFATTISKEANEAYLDASKIQWPLLCRTWVASDYFYPLGLGKKKKINQFLSNLKLSPTEKKRTNILATGDKIMWLVGKRIDDRFKLKPTSTKLLKISWQEKP